MSGRTKVLAAALVLCALLALALAAASRGATGVENLRSAGDATPGDSASVGDRGRLPNADPSATLADALESGTPVYVLIHSLT